MTQVPLKVKAALIFVFLAATPAVVTGAALIFVNTDAVKTSEGQLQTAVLFELATHVDQQLAAAEDDLRSVVDALELEMARSEQPSLSSVQAVLKTSRQLDSARLLVPEAGVDTLLFERDEPPPQRSLDSVDTSPGSASITVAEDGAVTLVRAVRASGGGKAGAVVATLRSELLTDYLERAARERFSSGGAKVLLVSSDYEVIADVGGGAKAGADVQAHPVWRLASPNHERPVVVVSDLQVDGVSMLGGVQSIPRLGWYVATWRPRDRAYATLDRMVERATWASSFAALFALGLGLFAAARLTRPIVAMAAQAERIGRRAWSELQPLPQSKDELGQLARSLGDMAGALQQSEVKLEEEAQLRTNLSRYMSGAVVDQVLRGELPARHVGKRQQVTVLFGSIVSFSSLTEEGRPEDIVGLLNELYSLVTEVIFRHGGIVDKFIGDSVMAAWGTPTPEPNHASRALDAADDILRFVSVANDDWEQRFGIRIRMAIGLNTGECIAGSLGSDKRLDYTLIGDVVNVAARLEREAAPDQVLITEATREAADEGFETTFIGEHRLTGRRKFTRVYALELAA